MLVALFMIRDLTSESFPSELNRDLDLPITGSVSHIQLSVTLLITLTLPLASRLHAEHVQCTQTQFSNTVTCMCRPCNLCWITVLNKNMRCTQSGGRGFAVSQNVVWEMQGSETDCHNILLNQQRRNSTTYIMCYNMYYCMTMTMTQWSVPSNECKTSQVSAILHNCPYLQHVLDGTLSTTQTLPTMMTIKLIKKDKSTWHQSASVSVSVATVK